MNIRAKCINQECAAFDKEKSVAVGQLLGYSAPNDGVICPLCGSLMKTTRTSARATTAVIVRAHRGAGAQVELPHAGNQLAGRVPGALAAAR